MVGGNCISDRPEPRAERLGDRHEPADRLRRVAQPPDVGEVAAHLDANTKSPGTRAAHASAVPGAGSR